jgi:hypothetical protein
VAAHDVRLFRLACEVGDVALHLLHVERLKGLGDDGVELEFGEERAQAGRGVGRRCWGGGDGCGGDWSDAPEGREVGVEAVDCALRDGGDDCIGRAEDDGRRVVGCMAILPAKGHLTCGISRSVRGIQLVQRVHHVGDVLIAPGRAQGRNGFVHGGALEPHELTAGAVRRCERPDRAFVGEVR